MANKTNYSQGWYWGKDIYRAKSRLARLRAYFSAMRNPITSVLGYCKKRGVRLNRILEVGCGGGNFGIRFIIHNLDVYFIDASMDMLGTCRYNIKKILFLKKAKEIEKIENKMFCQDMFNLGFKDEQFNLVISEGVYEHLHEKDVRIKFLNESKRVLKKGGCLFVAIPNNKHPLASYWKRKGYIWLDEINNPLFYEMTFSPDGFKGELEEAGFYDTYCDGSELWNFIRVYPNTRLRRIIAFLLKVFVPEMNRSIRIKFAKYLWVIGRKG